MGFMRWERARAVAPAPAVSPPAQLIASIRSSSAGEPLPADFRQRAEQRFGAGLGAVRVHTDRAAATAAEQLAAHAFTVGTDVFFAPGRYDAHSRSGQRLLAHEMAHVVQAQPGRAPSGSSWISRPGSPSERSADAVADRFVSDPNASRLASTLSRSAGVVQRDGPLAGSGSTTTAAPATAAGRGPGPGAAATGQADSPDEESAAVTVDRDALATIVAGCAASDVGSVVATLRGSSMAQRRALRTAVNPWIGVDLDHWFTRQLHYQQAAQQTIRAAGYVSALVLGGALLNVTAGEVAAAIGLPASGAGPEDGLRLLWPVMPLIDRLEVYDEGWRELEQAQIDTIRAASQAERNAARSGKNWARLETVYSLMDAKEEYEARCLINPSDAGRYAAAEQLLTRAPGFFHDEEDAVFDSLLALPPTLRRSFYDQHAAALTRLLADDFFAGRRLTLLRELSYGTEVQTLIARLRLATERRTDDTAGIQSAVDRAVALFQERARLRVSVNGQMGVAERAVAEARLAELNDLDELIRMRPGATGGFDPASFIGRVAATRDDAGAFAADAARFAEFATEADTRRYALATAKQRILLAGSDADEIRSAVMGLHAPRVATAAVPGGVAAQPAPASSTTASTSQYVEDVRLRQILMDDREVAAAVASLTGSERMTVSGSVSADAFDDMRISVNTAFNRAQWGEFFRLILVIARDDAWRSRFRATAGEFASTYSRVQGREREIMETILNTRHMPLAAVLEFSGDPATLRTALSELPEDDRGRLRLGFFLATRPTPIGPPTEEQDRALREYRAFAQSLRSSQTLVAFDAAGYQEVLESALGKEPTLAELVSERGRFLAVEVMYQQQRARLDLPQVASADFTESDETMVAAAREFARLFEPLRSAGTLTLVDFAALSTLHDRFEHRTSEFVEAVNAVGEMAGMVAATVAGIVVVAATGGTASPAVIALAAASGAGARVITREMFGGDYYRALSDAGARDALLGAIDGALAVLGQSLAARGAELVGLGGRTLATGAARVAGGAAEEATRTFSQRVAAGAVEAALDGAFSGAVSAAVGTMTDGRTWRRGIWQGMLQVGESALVSGLTGLATGGLVGAAMPVAGAGARWLRSAAARQSIDTALTRAGVGDALQAARQAARAGRAEEVNELFGHLESHLSAEQSAAFRQQLNDDLRSFLRHAPGAAQPSSDAEARLIQESGGFDGPALRSHGEHVEAEFDIVRRSEPQPSSVEGYVDEVDLGNDHVWRRKPNGTWCRFSRPDLCGVTIPGVRVLTPQQLSSARVLHTRIHAVGEQISEASKLVRDYEGVVDKLVAARQPNGLANLAVLTDHELAVLGDVFPKADLDQLSLREIQWARGERAAPGTSQAPRTHGGRRLGVAERELQTLIESQERLIRELGEAKRPLYDKLRAASPSGRATLKVESRAAGLDQISGQLPVSGALDIDHILPLTEIMKLRDFELLTWADQFAIADDLANLRAVDRAANRSRGNRSWNDAWPLRNTYSVTALQAAGDLEEAARAHLQDLVDRCRMQPGYAAARRLQ
jgi:Domain of unknown function (DUF4157)